MKALYKFHFDCGKNGVLYGLFIEDIEKVDELMDSGRIIYFGEVLGKNSDIMGPIEEEDITFITDDEKVLAIIDHFNLSTGFNPFDYNQVEDDDLEDIDDE